MLHLLGPQTDLQTSAVRLRRQNPVTYREAKTLLYSRYNGDWKTTVDIRHTLTQFGDWSGISRPLYSACAQSIAV